MIHVPHLYNKGFNFSILFFLNPSHVSSFIFKPKGEVKKIMHDISINEMKKITNFSCKGTPHFSLTNYNHFGEFEALDSP